MLRSFFLSFLLMIAIGLAAQEYQHDYSFFTNSSMPGYWFFSKADTGGGASVKNIDGKLPVSADIFHTPGNSLQLNFTNTAGGGWKTEIFHQDLRGVNFFKKTGALSFWIYMNTENAPADEWPLVQLVRRDSSKTAAVRVPPAKTRMWQRIVIPFDSFKVKKQEMADNFIAVAFLQNTNSMQGLTCDLYLDDIGFITGNSSGTITQKAKITEAKGYEKHVDIVWEKVTDPNVCLVKIRRLAEGGDTVEAGVQVPYIDRYADYTGETGKKYTYFISFLDNDYKESALSSPVKATTGIMTDDDLLTMVQEASFRYYWEGAEPNSGMAREDIPGRQNMIATGASGFGIMALIVGTERKFITRGESVDRFLQILDFLEKADRFHGVYGHFMNGTTGKVVPFFSQRDNGADLVETAFLMEGLLAARQYFDGKSEKERTIREKITALWQGVEWDWFRKEPESKYLYWHWSPDQAWVINHRLIGWNETMVVYLLAIASPTHSVPASLYYSGWASQEPVAQKYRQNWGGSAVGSRYTNGNYYSGMKLPVGVNNGGPLFFTHYSYMGYDPHFITDKYTNYFDNNQTIARINNKYCIANPKHYKGYGEGGWGLTASDGPYDYSADEPMPARDPGKLTPTGAIASFPYTPAESMKALKNYYFNNGHFLWGEYGFRDAFNLTENWCSPIYMGLNQAPQVVMIENFRTGLIWKLFMQDPEIQAGLKKLAEEKGE